MYIWMLEFISFWVIEFSEPLFQKLKSSPACMLNLWTHQLEANELKTHKLTNS